MISIMCYFKFECSCSVIAQQNVFCKTPWLLINIKGSLICGGWNNIIILLNNYIKILCYKAVISESGRHYSVKFYKNKTLKTYIYNLILMI